MISVRDLAVEIGSVRVLDGVSFELEEGKSLALVGASGAGKSMTALALMGLLPRPGARVAAGEIVVFGRDVSRMNDEELRAMRGKDVAIVFQDAASALNPIQTIGAQIAEAARAHRSLSRAEAEARAIEMLARVKMPEPRESARRYPHQLSGGMQQRAMIAMALVNSPRLLIADEATSSVDVTIQAELLELFRREKSESKLGLLLITHDLAIVPGLCEETAVMASGRIVEHAATDALFASPAHELTRALVALARGARA